MQNINKISFNKNPKTSEELIQQLQDRGMIIEDEIFVKDILSKVNYYRLSGYWFKHQYKYIKEKVIKIIPFFYKTVKAMYWLHTYATFCYFQQGTLKELLSLKKNEVFCYYNILTILLANF